MKNIWNPGNWNPPSPRGRRREQGSVLLITIFIGVLFGMLLLYCYLPLINNQSVSVIRSQAWNAALAMAEAGADEALAQLNPGAPAPPVIDRTANGWGAPAGGFYGPMKRSLADGSYSVVFTTAAYPTIYSTGYVTVPTLKATLIRTVRVTTTNTPLFNSGLVAKYGISMNGNKVFTDSFNSANSNLSVNGRYPDTDPSKTSANGTIGSLYGPVSLGTSTVHGDELLGATATTSGGNVSGGVYHNFNADFTDVILPVASTNWGPAPSANATIGGVTYQYALTNSGAWTISNLGGSVYIGTNALVTLELIGNASPSVIRVAGSGANAGQLTIYMNGSSFKLSGSSSVDGGNATNLFYYGLPVNTSITMNANASFTGVLYAPEAALNLSGGGTDSYDFVGSATVSSASIGGNFSFHYDENLAKVGPAQGYVANSWREL